MGTGPDPRTPYRHGLRPTLPGRPAAAGGEGRPGFTSPERGGRGRRGRPRAGDGRCAARARGGRGRQSTPPRRPGRRPYGPTGRTAAGQGRRGPGGGAGWSPRPVIQRCPFGCRRSRSAPKDVARGRYACAGFRSARNRHRPPCRRAALRRIRSAVPKTVERNGVYRPMTVTAAPGTAPCQ